MKQGTAWILCMVLAVAAAAQESFNTTPPPVTSDFSCSGRQMGFYADASTNCRAYHTCDDHGNHFTHYCPEDTAFRQDAMVCDHAYLVDCQANINNAPLRSRIDLDDNHDAPPSSFVEPRGEGTNAKGYARSFRINPDSKNNANSKYPTFVLNSSVFLKNRDSGVGRSINTETHSRDSHDDYSRTDHHQKTFHTNHKEDSPSPFRSRETVTRNSLSTTPRTTISENLQPPVESPRISKVFDDFQPDEFSFLVPPDVRDDNVYFQKDTFESMKNDNSQFNRDSFDAFKSSDGNESFEKVSVAPVTFSPRTKMVLDMVKARGLARDSDSSFHVPKPVNFLKPPIFPKPESTPFARFNFNFHNDDYPYVETLRSIQNNKPSTSSFNSSPLIRLAPTTPRPKFSATEASIFPIPTKQLVPVSDVELDPYYPKDTTTTESYYTPRQQANKPRKPYFTTRRPQTNSAKFEIPSVLPDLNSLEDLLDRRKFFFIPRLKSV
ncbi:uncharacterized protein LOC100678436 [Nasonia vitripennis]|uniref:Chitin-binding type-2 domain-containing protein n=1 Tax=Nasonia vitripennis TaxID=7425 RepID=A0A7M7GHN6_NASVI|nr:uncharacterized protein LOC100678436 [Nasonia vitripennis]XP_016843064.1 uncharacterized protein LOC100678436 [Nasonia vitripennis]